MFTHLFHSRLFLLTLAVAAVTGVVVTLSPATRFLRGSLTDDRVLTLCDTNADGMFEISEMRRCISSTITAIVRNTPAYDLDGSGTVNRADLRILIQSIRAFLSAECGNGQAEAGEQCDDGNQSNADACTNACTMPFCGNSAVEGTEQCDDGNQLNADACTNACRMLSCGDGFIQSTEECDDGNQINTDACTNSCKNAVCGDGFKQGAEQCDDGNQVNTDACLNTCIIPVCGNGILEGTEQCDDGNQINNDTCTGLCKNASCGDGFIQGAEQCDDTNQINTDSCTNVCANAACGDGFKQGTEQCDDGNQINADSCTNICKNAVCGDGFQQGTEQCDDGNLINNDTCTGICKLASCGDGFIQGAEQCDDGNQISTDFCSNSCKAPLCGDGFKQGTEQCDDGNQIDTDTCTGLCKNAVCGDGFRQGAEQCDDGNQVNTDTCTTLCKLPACGDGFKQGAEQCDDGNTMDSDICSNACIPAVCGEITEYSIATSGSGPHGIAKGPNSTLWFTQKNVNKVAKRAPDGTVTEYTLPSINNSLPMDITAGLDGNMYIVEYSSTYGNKIARLFPNGGFEEVPIPTGNSQPFGITTGLDGSIWFSEYAGNKVGKIPFNGGVPQEFAIPTPGSTPSGIATGPTGDIWIAARGANRIVRMSPSGIPSEFASLPVGSIPQRIARGPDGNMWFTEAIGKIGRVNANETIDHFVIPTSGSSPIAITGGPDGNVWFTEPGANKIGKITPQGTITEFTIPTPEQKQLPSITTGPDGNIWFTEPLSNKLGKIQVCPGTGVCGNGIREGTEQCEDKNAVSGDGCSASCAIEAGFTCTGVPVSTCLPTVPVCGDGYKQGTEECDDKNRVNDDACSNVCKIAVCGDSIVQPATEQCDDGNTANGDDCSSSCQSTFSIANSCTDAGAFKSIGTSPAFISSILSYNDSAYAVGFVAQPDLKSKMSVYRHSKNGTGSLWLPEATLGVPSVGARATILNAGGTLFVYKQKDAGQWTEATREDLVFRRTASGQWESLGSPWKSPDIPQISSLAVLNGVPYVSVSNYGFVYRYDGNKSWTQLGTTAITNIGNLTSVYGKLYALGSFLGYNVDFSQSWVGRIVVWDGASWMGAASMWSVKQIQADASNLLIVGRESSSDSTPWRVYRVPSDSATTVDTHIYDAMQPWQWPILGVVDGTLFGFIANAGTLHVYPSFGQGWKNIGTFSYSDIVSTPNGSISFDLQDGLVILKTNLTCKKVSVPTLLITCGNGLKQGAEECDDGNQVDQDFCRNSCVLARCGDSIVQGAEQCDAGGNTATCTNTCQNRPAACGDGYQQGIEQCDDGNLANGDGCTSTCTTVCGDGIKKGIEQCDDGDSNDANGCKNNCRLPPPPPLICRRISCTQFASHSGVGYHQLSYLGLSNGTPYYAGCNLYGTKYLIHGLTGQITTNGTCPQSNVLTGSPVDGALATQISGMLGKSLTQPPTIVTSPTLGSYFAAINGHNSKVTIGGAGFSFQAQSCGVEEYSCDCAAPDLVDPRYCYQKASGSGYTPVCGDGSIEGTEQCDDRNTSAGDGCSSACTIEAAPAASCGAAGSPVICNNSSNPCKQSGFTVPMCKSFGSTNPVVMPICCGTSTYSATGCIPADCR